MKKKITIFLAGTIDDGHSSDWQAEIIKACSDIEEVEFYNPRRYDFPEHPKKEDVVNQIRWEQEYLDKADYIIMNILPGSKSPISLLELGLYAESGKIIVHCPESFYRYTNVEETCCKYAIYLNNDTSIQALKESVHEIVCLEKEIQNIEDIG